MVVYPPDAQGGRRVRCDGDVLGRALVPGDLVAFLGRAGLDPDDVRLDDALRPGGVGDFLSPAFGTSCANLHNGARADGNTTHGTGAADGNLPGLPVGSPRVVVSGAGLSRRVRRHGAHERVVEPSFAQKASA